MIVKIRERERATRERNLFINISLAGLAHLGDRRLRAEHDRWLDNYDTRRPTLHFEWLEVLRLYNKSILGDTSLPLVCEASKSFSEKDAASSCGFQDGAL